MTAAIQPRLEMINISKSFPGAIANDRISMRVHPGEIHGVLGENGAGKSTLMNIIYGVVKPDSGSLLWDNKEVSITDPLHARQLGVGMVFQHFSLLETLTVDENLRLSMPAYETVSMQEKLDQLAENYGLEIELDALVNNLTVGQKQRVEIARCLLQNVKLLILDEPTSVLTPSEAEDLLAILKNLAAEGCSILFISHKLNEVRAICDQASILRSGRVIGSCQPKHESKETITEMMIGSDIEIEQHFSTVSPSKVKLSLNSLSMKNHSKVSLTDFSLQMYEGEILGLAGVAGNGQDQILNLINGETKVSAGKIKLNEIDITDYSVRQRRQLGISTLPVERLNRCTAKNLPLKDNFFLTNYLNTDHQKQLIDWQSVEQLTNQVIDTYNVKAGSSHSPATSLSGGNLQKFLVGRETYKVPSVLVCYNPTWGVDVGAANFIHKSLISLRDQGSSILVISEDLDELFTISDRIGGICAGKLSPIKSKIEVDIALLGQWMTGDFVEHRTAEAS